MKLLRSLFSLLALASLTSTLHARLVIVGDTVHRSVLTPGAPVSGSISVLNTGSSPVEIRVYQSDYIFQASGENSFPNPGTLAQSNAKWLTLDSAQFSVPTNATITVNYRGATPAGSARGTYWSLILIEQTEAVQAPSSNGSKDNRKAAIRTVIRHAVQIITEIGNPGAPELKVLAKKFENDPKKRTFTLDVLNRGSWMTRPDVSLELIPASGAENTKLSATQVRLYPGCSYRYSFDFSKIPAGKYTALIVFDSGDDNVSGAQYALDVP